MSTFSTGETRAPYARNTATPHEVVIPAYPRARVPTQPVLSLASFRRRGGRHIPSVLDAGNAEFVTSGRIAIALALQQMNVGPNDQVLVPAYHCASMVEPVLWTGATPVFYRINPDTSVNLDDVRSKLDPSTKVLLATNYFGFHQNLSALREFCDQNALLLLEDCAHSFIGEHEGRPIGSFGDYAIASSMKFFPVYEGGCLVSSRRPIKPLNLHSAGAAFELKAAVNALEKSFEYGRMPYLARAMAALLGLKNSVWGRIKQTSRSKAVSIGPCASDGGFGFEAAWLEKRSSFFSRQLVKRVSKTRMAAKRREHYIVLQRALSELPGSRPLFAELPEGVYPWVFPLRTDSLRDVFPSLKNAGVPVIRFGEFLWPGVDAGVCANSVDLSENVMQFPCHQDLSQQELDWMIATIKAVVSSRKTGPT